MQFDAGAPGEGESGASLGTIVENRNIQSSLAKRLAAVGNSVQVFDSVTVSRVASGSDASASADSVDRPALDNFALVELRHQDGSTRQLRTRLLVRLLLGFILDRVSAELTVLIFAFIQVGADGAQSRVRQYLGMSSHGFDYNQRYASSFLPTISLMMGDDAIFISFSSRFAFLRPKLQRRCGHCSHEDTARYCISAFPAHGPSGRLASTRALSVCLFFARSTH